MKSLTMKKIFILVLAVALIAAIMVGCTEKETLEVDPDVELLTNGNFERTTPDDGWTVTKSGEGSTVKFPNLNIQAEGADVKHGRNYAMIASTSGSKSVTKLSQKLEIQPHSTYKLSVEYKVTSAITVADGGKGAYVTLDGFKYLFRSETSATDGWGTWELYFNSDEYEEVTVLLGLGETDYEVQGGTVYFDNVSLMRLTDEAAAGVAAQNLSTANTLETSYDAAYRMTTEDIVFTVLIVVLSAALLVAAYFLLRRMSSKKEEQVADNGMVKGGSILKNTTLLLVVTLIVGFGIRLVMSLVLYGYGAYENTVMTYTAAMVEDGLMETYYQYGSYYAPFTTYVLYILGLIAAPLKLTAGTQGMAIFLKIPALIADLLLIAFVFVAVDKRKGSMWALVTGLVLALMPIFYIASSLWGVYTSVAVLFLYLAFAAVRERKVIKMTVFYFLAVLFAEEALILLPLLLVYAIMLYVKYPETRIKLPIAATAAVIAGYAVTVPLAINFYVAGRPFIVLERMVTVFNQNTYFARNIFNIYSMCAVGAESVNTAGIVMGAIFAAIAMLGGIGLYLFNRNRQDILLYASWTLIAVYTLCVRMNPWVLMMGLVLLYAYVLYTDEKRLMWVVGALSAISSVNLCYLMAIGGNVKGGVGAAGVAIASKDPVAIVFSVLMVLTFLGLTYVVVDICLGRKKPIMALTLSAKDAKQSAKEE